MKPDEFLESVCRDAFQRELEVDENVARTLPFFAAALALAATLYGYILTQLVPLNWTLLAIILHLMLLVGGALLVGVVFALFQAVRAREYRLPPKETALSSWASELETYFKEQGLTPATVDAKVLKQLRDRMVAEYAEAAEHNREANLPKLKARSLGFTLLVIMLGIAFLIIGIMFVAQRLDPSLRQEPKHAAATQGEAKKGGSEEVGSVQKNANGAKGASAPSRDQILGDPGGEHSGKTMSEEKTPATPSPPPAETKPDPPPPPAHQLLKKSEDGGGPLTERR